MEIIEDGRSGLLVAPGDDEALAAGLARLLEDPDLAERMAVQAAHEAVERFSAKAHVGLIEGVYDSVLEEYGAQR
jgi:glycosyltransferase involved in cell wall biosynthesis